METFIIVMIVGAFLAVINYGMGYSDGYDKGYLEGKEDAFAGVSREEGKKSRKRAR